MSFLKQDRDQYEKEHQTYRQPRYAFRKIIGRLLPNIPGFRIRKKLYSLLGYRIDPNVKFIGLDCYIDDHFPELIEVGPDVIISFKVTLVAHDDATHVVAPIRIGRGAFIGTGAIILPGVDIGENAVVGAGAVVSCDIPPGKKAIGVPAKIIE